MGKRANEFFPSGETFYLYPAGLFASAGIIYQPSRMFCLQWVAPTDIPVTKNSKFVQGGLFVTYRWGVLIKKKAAMS